MIEIDIVTRPDEGVGLDRRSYSMTPIEAIEHGQKLITAAVRAMQIAVSGKPN